MIIWGPSLQVTYRGIFSLAMTIKIGLVPHTKWKMWLVRLSMNLIRLLLIQQQLLIWPPWWAVIMESIDRCLDPWVLRLRWEMQIIAAIAKTVVITTLEPYLNLLISWMYYKRLRWLWKLDRIFCPLSILLEVLKASLWKDLSRTSLSRSCRAKLVVFLKNPL